MAKPTIRYTDKDGNTKGYKIRDVKKTVADVVKETERGKNPELRVNRLGRKKYVQGKPNRSKRDNLSELPTMRW